MLAAVAPLWDGNETWLVVAGVVLWGAFPGRLCDTVLCLLSAASPHARRFDPARRGVRVPQQDGTVAVDLGRKLCRRLPCCGFHSGHDGRRARRRSSHFERAICRRRIRLAQSVLGALRHRPLSRLHPARRLLAGAEMHRRGPRQGLPPDSLAVDRPAGLPDRGLRLCLGRKSPDHEPMARTALSVRLSRHWYRCSNRTRCKRSPTSRRAAVLYGRRLFSPRRSARSPSLSGRT